MPRWWAIVGLALACRGEVTERAVWLGESAVAVERTEVRRSGGRVTWRRERRWGPGGRDGRSLTEVVADDDGVLRSLHREGMGGTDPVVAGRGLVWLELATGALRSAAAGASVTVPTVDGTVTLAGGDGWVEVPTGRWRVDGSGGVVARDEPPLRVEGTPPATIVSPAEALAVPAPGLAPGRWRASLRLADGVPTDAIARGPRVRLDGRLLELSAPLRAELPADVARRLDAAVASVRADLVVAPVSEPLDPRAILARGQGDCSEHVALFVARLAEQGVAARPVVGLAAEAGRLVPHAWAEVEVDGAWIPVDPVRGEVPADAARVPFRGDLSPAELVAAWASFAVDP